MPDENAGRAMGVLVGISVGTTVAVADGLLLGVAVTLTSWAGELVGSG
jgi:hypothetical protein